METLYVPPTAGETRLFVITFAPDLVSASPGFDGAAAGQEAFAHMPELVRHFEPDGTHRTDTVDYAFVLEGEIWLEVDEGDAVCLRPGDIVVQTGTRHAWRNKTDRTAKVAFVMIGADVKD